MSSHKGLARRIERKLESSVGNAFARVFGGSIVPQEVEALLRREAEYGVRALQGNRLLAPNEYIITLGVYDFEKVGADQDLKSADFATYLAGYIHEQGWQTYGEVVVRFEQSSNLHTGQLRARGAVNPDVETRPPVDDPARPQSNQAFGAEPGVAPMTDNPSYRGPGQGRPGDEYYDDRYARPQEDPRAGAEPHGGQDPRGGYPPEQAGYPPQQGYPPPRQPEQGGYPTKAATPTSAVATPTKAATKTSAVATPTKAATRTSAVIKNRPATHHRPMTSVPLPLPATAIRATARVAPTPLPAPLAAVSRATSLAMAGTATMRRELAGRLARTRVVMRSPNNGRLTPTAADTTRVISRAPRDTASRSTGRPTTPSTANPRRLRTAQRRLPRDGQPRIRLRPTGRRRIRPAGERLRGLRARRLWIRRNVGDLAAR